MKTALQSLLLTGLLTLAVGSLHAQSMVPASMNYQGTLTDNNGTPLAATAPENRNVEFRIYSQASGGTPLWGESQTVTVFKGYFSVVLGNGTAVGGVPSGPASFAAVFANATTADLYFGITPQAGVEFAPRQKMLSSAYALRARVAEQVNQSTGDSRFNWIYANNLTMKGHTKIEGGNLLEFGVNDPTRARNTAAGQIGYQIMSSGLDITGAGVETANRRITMWAEAGTDFKGPISFGGRYGQAISFNDALNGIGSQNEGIYLRGYERVSFFANGVHNNEGANPGLNGTLLGTISRGGFTLNSGKFVGDGSGLTNINPNSLPNNYNYLGINGGNVIEFGRGSAGKQGDAGKIGYGTFSNGDSLDIIGAGKEGGLRKIKLFGEAALTGSLLIEWNLRTNGHIEAMSNLYAKRNISIEGSGQLNFETPNRLGQHINLYGSDYGIGIGNNAMYQRTSGGGSFRWYTGGSHDGNGPGNGGAELSNWNNERVDFYRRVNVDGNLNSTGTMTAGWYGFNGNGSWKMTAGSDLDIYYGSGRRAWLLTNTGNWQVPSDRNLKKDIQPIGGGLADIMRLKPSLYHYKVQEDGELLQPGFIAQEVEEVFPQLVSQKDGVRGMDYTGLIPFTVVQEQQQKVEELSHENADLKKRLEALEKKLEKLADQLPEASAETSESNVVR